MKSELLSQSTKTQFFGLLGLIVILALVARSDSAELKPLEADSMRRADYPAGSRNDPQALGGYWRSDNFPKHCKDKQCGPDTHVSLIALPAETVPFAEQYQGFRLLLVNRTAAEVPFQACDSRLYIICEALDANGHWQPIEHEPRSFCGNSYHKVFLPSGHYWEFAVPVYSGVFKTKLRFCLLGNQPIYSNEFDGKINPARLAAGTAENCRFCSNPKLRFFCSQHPPLVAE